MRRKSEFYFTAELWLKKETLQFSFGDGIIYKWLGFSFPTAESKALTEIMKVEFLNVKIKCMNAFHWWSI